MEKKKSVRAQEDPVAKRAEVAPTGPTPVIVGYSLCAPVEPELTTDLRKEFTRTLRAPSNYKDPDKIEAYLSAASSEYDEAALEQPYSATFDCVTLVAPTLQEAVTWKAADDSKPLVGRLASWLWSRWPVYLYGFRINRFIDVLYTECARRNFRVPTELWLDREARPCRDVGRLLVPSGYDKFLTVAMALKAFGKQLGGVPTEGFTPGVKPLNDVSLAYELLVRLDIVPVAS